MVLTGLVTSVGTVWTHALMKKGLRLDLLLLMSYLRVSGPTP